MTREGYNKHKEVFEAWINGKQIQILAENEQWVDCPDNVKWKEHKEYRVKPTKLYTLEDCYFNRVEYEINNSGLVTEYNTNNDDFPKYEHTLISDKSLAEAYAVLPLLIRLRDRYNGNWKPNYKDGVDKYYIIFCDDEIKLPIAGYTQRILVFKTEEIRDRFFKDHKNLIKIAKPLL